MHALVADDDTTLRTILTARLKKWEYTVTSVADGDAAWEILCSDNPPQIALLDWMMPGNTGPELCGKLKNREARSSTYAILITARDEKQDLLAGLEAGADDYISKPVDFAELKIRLLAGRRIIEAERRLLEYGSQMEALAKERAQQLVHSDRLATLGTMAAGIAHEINNPLAYLYGNAQNLERSWPHIETALQRDIDNGMADKKRATFILEEVPGMLESFRKGVERIDTIVRGLRDFSRRDDKNDDDLCDVNKSLEEALVICSNQIKHQVEIKRNFAADLPLVKAVSQQLEQVFINLFMNAAQAMEPQGGGKLTLKTELAGRVVRITISDTGPGIPESRLNEIWSAFFTTKGKGKGTGLGLSISKGIVEDCGGEIRGSNKPTGGACFTVELPHA